MCGRHWYCGAHVWWQGLHGNPRLIQRPPAQMSGASSERDGAAGAAALGSRSHRGPQLASDDEDEEDERQAMALGGSSARDAVLER